MAPIITLLTDFGIKDGYVAAMKGVILGICPEARMVDLSHLIPPQDVRAGAFLLACVYRDFPGRTVHLAVVDPDVGTERRALAIQTERYFFVGPDNGLFSWILKQEPAHEVRSLENREYWRSPVSKTFHGRDIFAPVAAHLACRTPIDLLGPPCAPEIAQWSSITRSEECLNGEVVYIDHFGNVITNLTGEDLKSFARGGEWVFHAGTHTISSFVSTYGREKPGAVIALIASSGHLEFAVSRGNAANTLGIRPGDAVTACRRR